MAILFAGGNCYLDDVAVEDVRRFESELYQFLDNSKPEVVQSIREKKELNDEIKSQLNDALKEFKGQRFRSSKDLKEDKAKSGKSELGERGARPSEKGTRDGKEARVADEAQKVPAQV